MSDNFYIRRGTYDYFGLNHYSSVVAERLPLDDMVNWPSDEGMLSSYDPSWESGQSSWMKVGQNSSVFV